MGQLFVILMRILFPRDPVARCRELMRVWLDQLIDCVTDPEEIESLVYWSEDRAKLEGMIAFLEYFMRVLTYGRARQMLGLQHIHIPLQPKPRIRNPSNMAALIKRITQLARDFHNLDRLAARRTKQMKRERDSDPLRLDAPHQATSLMLRMVEDYTALDVLPRRRRGRWIGAYSRRDGGGCAFARGCLHALGLPQTRGPPAITFPQPAPNRPESPCFPDRARLPKRHVPRYLRRKGGNDPPLAKNDSRETQCA